MAKGKTLNLFGPDGEAVGYVNATILRRRGALVVAPESNKRKNSASA